MNVLSMKKANKRICGFQGLAFRGQGHLRFKVYIFYATENGLVSGYIACEVKHRI